MRHNLTLAHDEKRLHRIIFALPADLAGLAASGRIARFWRLRALLSSGRHGVAVYQFLGGVSPSFSLSFKIVIDPGRRSPARLRLHFAFILDVGASRELVVVRAIGRDYLLDQT